MADYCRQSLSLSEYESHESNEYPLSRIRESLMVDFPLRAVELNHQGSKFNADDNYNDNGELNGEINALTSALREVYPIVKRNPGIKIKEVADARGRSESTVVKQLGELVEKGITEYQGAKRTGGYYAK